MLLIQCSVIDKPAHMSGVTV